MIKIANILVATDFSDASAAALAYGRELARNYGATLHVIHAIDDIRWRYSLDMTPVLMSGVQQSLEEAAQQQMKELLTDEDRHQLRATVHIEQAISIADAIVACAERIKASVLIIGTHGRSGLRHYFLGSVAERVLRTAQCPVLTVKAHERDFIAPDALAAPTRAE